MMTRKAYKDLIVADFIGMTDDQIRDVLESYKEDEERRQYQLNKLNESVANFSDHEDIPDSNRKVQDGDPVE